MHILKIRFDCIMWNRFEFSTILIRSSCTLSSL